MTSAALKAVNRLGVGRTPLRRPGWGGRSSHLAIRVASILACLLFWQVASTLKLDLGFVTFRNTPSPGQIAIALWSFVQSPNATHHLAASLSRIGQGFLLATIVGTGLGLLVGRYAIVRAVAMPPLEIIRPIPAVAWIPLAILMLPTSEGSMVFITFLGAFFPILLNTVHGVESVDTRLIASARSLGAGAPSIFREVIGPSALPSIITGLVLGVGSAWFCLVTAEMISGQYGIGYYTWMSYTVQDYPGTVVGMILIGLLGMGSSAAVKAFGRVLTPWRNVDAGSRR